ncbi:MAG: hypothetical protein AAGA57_00675 [Planctomycetota bacterium]
MSKRLGWLTMSAAALAYGGAAWAQETPDAGRLEGGQAWLYIVTGILLTAAAGVMSFMSPKRGHQD